jgi:hypothetical protein
VDDERAQILDTVRAYFGPDEVDAELVVDGPLLEWERLSAENPWGEQYDRTYAFDRAKVVELHGDRAVVELAAGRTDRVKRGTHAFEHRYDGPVELRKVDGRWRIVDYVFNGRRRSAGLLLGPLAEQARDRVTVRVLAVDRFTHGTIYVVELANGGASAVRLARAFALFESKTSWAQLSVAPHEPIEPGASRRLLMSTTNVPSLDDPFAAVALDVRAGGRRVPFVLRVPMARPATLVPQPPARRLPVLRSTWPRSLLFYGAVTAAGAWTVGAFAVVVPVFVVVLVYSGIRRSGHLPERLHRLRHVLDGLVAAGALAVLWFSPAADLVVPIVVAAVVFVALRPLGRGRLEARFVLAVSAGGAWLFLLGLPGGPLSPCRLAAGRPAATADEFLLAALTGDRARARSLERSTPTGTPFPKPMPARDVAALVATRTGGGGEEGLGAFCSVLDAVACYRYGSPPDGGETRALLVAIDCDGKRWKVAMWLRSF